MEQKSRFRLWHIPLLILLILGTVWIALSEKHPVDIPFQRNEGAIFGTIYHSTYQYKEDINDEILAALNQVDASLSMFNPSSTISKINSGESDLTDSLLLHVLQLSKTISKETDGAFDVTVAPLVNAWGFGFKSNTFPDSAMVDSLRGLVGWDKLTVEGNRLVKADPNMIIDFSAVAKGFGVDWVARLFQKKGIRNFMIEIGGEVITSGTNPKNELWHIGINSPEEDSIQGGNELQVILAMSDCAMATSGNYRNYYLHDGKRIAHTIDPKTGYPVQHSILSSTVLAPSCAMADGYATSFMVLGLEKAKEVLSLHPELQAYFIYSDEKGENKVWYTPSLKQFFTE